MEHTERSLASWCCVSTLSSRELAGFQQSKEPRDMNLTLNQPQFVPAPRFEPQQPVRQNVSQRFSWDISHSNRSRSSSFAKLSRPWTLQSRSRPSISAPMDFRRVTEPTEPMPTARRSFRPIELSIYMPAGRISPLPNFDSDEWTGRLPDLRKPEAAFLRREAIDNSELPSEIRRKPLSITTTKNLQREILLEPFLCMDDGSGPLVRRDTLDSMRNLPDLATINEDRMPTLNHDQFDEATPGMSRPRSSHSSILSPPLRMRSPSPFTVGRSRSKTDENLSRNGSVRRSKNDTIDDAIKELNTIVEQKRIKATIGAHDSVDAVPLSPTSHVPAIAPSMKSKARSETLMSIGSAFSVSYANKPMAAVPRLSAASTGTQMSPSPLSALPLATSNSSIPSDSSTALGNSSKTSTTSRLTTWLRQSLPGFPATPTALKSFYQTTPLATAPGFPHHVRNSSSLSSALSNSQRDSLSTRASSPYPYKSATPTTTIAGSILGAPTTPDDLFPPPRPDLSQTPKVSRRTGQLKRGLSIDTTLSNRSVLTPGSPPAYEEVESNPNTANKEAFGILITPSRVGMAL